MSVQAVDKTKNSVFFFAALFVGALCGYTASLIATVSDIKSANRLEPSIMNYDFEGFNSGYVVVSIALGICALSYAHYRMNSAETAPSDSKFSGADGIDELMDQARASNIESQQPVAV